MLRALVVLTLSTPASALACSGSLCIGYPTYPKSGSLPAHMVAIDINASPEQRAALKLVRLDTRSEVPFRSEELPPDAEYSTWYRLSPS
ncbi:MAG: hypothetical protein ABW352_02135 [Polyangiales bacterium]